MDWRAVATVAHVLAAFWFVAGYVGTNALTEIARRAATHEARVAALALSDQFDRWLYQRGGTAVLLTGALCMAGCSATPSPRRGSSPRWR